MWLMRSIISSRLPFPHLVIRRFWLPLERASAAVYVFPNQRTPNGSRPMSDAAITSAYRALGQ